MYLSQLWLNNFRNYENCHLTFEKGTTVITGNKGNGKTNLLEAIAWLAKGKSFRGAPNEALIFYGKDHAIIRAETIHKERKTTLEVKLNVSNRNQLQVNGKKIIKKKELYEKIKTTIFSPEDLILIKGSPGERRNYLDELLVDLHPKNQIIKTNFEKCLKQRNTLLKQAKGRQTKEIETTLDIWDEKLADSGQKLIIKRNELLEKLKPEIEYCLKTFTKNQDSIDLKYKQSWNDEKTIENLNQERETDLRRGVTTIGPHRDDIEININKLLSKNHSSQGEQRSLALALRLAGHEIIKTATEQEPIVLLDDVFSELDDTRCEILVDLLPKKQAILTTTGELPHGVNPDHNYHIVEGSVETNDQ